MVLPPLVGVMSFMFLYGESGLVTRFLQDLFGLQEPPFRLGGWREFCWFTPTPCMFIST